jgi:glutathione synthase
VLLRTQLMIKKMTPNYPPELTSEQAEYLLSNLKNWSILNGLAVRPSHNYISKDVDRSDSIAIPAPVTLFPSVFPRSCFNEARDIQQAFNELYAAIATDEAWLMDAIAE